MIDDVDSAVGLTYGQPRCNWRGADETRLIRDLIEIKALSPVRPEFRLDKLF
jgi:hypothetical protein